MWTFVNITNTSQPYNTDRHTHTHTCTHTACTHTLTHCMHAHSLTCTQVQRCHPRTPPAAREWKPSLCPSSQWGSPLVPSPTVEVNWELWCPGKTVEPLALTDDWCLVQQHVTGCNTTLARYCKSWHGYVLKLYHSITLFHDSLHMWSIYRQEIPNR